MKFSIFVQVYLNEISIPILPYSDSNFSLCFPALFGMIRPIQNNIILLWEAGSYGKRPVSLYKEGR